MLAFLVDLSRGRPNKFGSEGLRGRKTSVFYALFCIFDAGFTALSQRLDGGNLGFGHVKGRTG